MLRLYPKSTLCKLMQDRQCEGRGFAGAGLGDADEIAAGEHVRNGLGLDRCGRDVLFFGKSSRNRRGKAEMVK